MLTLPRLRSTDAPDFLIRFFSSVKTPVADEFVCRVMRDSCPDVWAANDLTSLGKCEAKLAALPFADGDLAYIDGNTCASLPHSLPQAHYVGTAYISCKMPTPYPTKVLEY